MAWWRGTRVDDGNDPRDEYARRLKVIRHQLPPDLLATQETVSLHDTRLRELVVLVVLVAAKSARLVLESHSGDERFTLSYFGLERVESNADPAIGLRGPHGYDEVEVLPTGAFEHRMVFSSGVELCVVFGGFSLQRENRT